MTAGARSARDTVWFHWFVALLLLVLAVGWKLRSFDPVSSAEALLLQGADHARPHGWRVPGAMWVPVRLTRQANGATSKSAKWLRAEAMIAENLASGDSRWKGLAARAALLDHKPAAAIQLLGSLQNPTSAELSILAAAFAIRSSLENRPSDLGAAVDHAVRALEANPADGTARFTLASAFESLSMVEESVAEWNRFLEIEREQNWREEATQHLEGLRKLQRLRTAALNAANPADAVLDASPLQLLQDRRRAAELGSEVAAVDPWLAAAAAEAVDSGPLLDAAKANLSDRYDAVLASLTQAQALYAAAPAHAARLRLEAVFAHNRLRSTAACIELADRLQSLPYTWIRVQALSHSSGCLRMQGKTAAAFERQRAAIALAQSRGLESLALRAASVLVYQLTDSGDLWEAWQQNRRLLGTLQTSPFAVTRIHQCLVNYSGAAERRGWNAAAAVFMRAAADTLVATSHKTSQAANRATAATLAMRAGLPSIASRETMLASAILATEPDSVAKSGSSESVRILFAETWLALGKPREAIGALQELSPRISPVEQRRIGRVLGIAQAMLGNDAESLRHLEPMVQALETEMEGMRRAEASAMRREQDTAFRTLAQLQVRAGDPDKALRFWIRANGGDPALALPDLVWLRMDDGYAVWTQGRFRRLRVSHASLDSTIQRLVAQASNPDAKPPRAELERIRQLLFDEAADPCPGGGRELTVLADGAVASLPFAMLMDRCAVILTSTAAAPQSAALANSAALVVHNPETPEGLPYLADAVLEAEAAVSATGSATAPITGRDATQAAVLQRLPTVRLFHFAGHGYSGSTAGGLYLADGLFSADSIRNLDLRACSLVVLSACSTGGGEASNRHSLVRSFLDAGARNVIATRWNVDSAATSALMRAFYRRMQATPNVTPAQALHQAVSEIRSQPNHSHPYYWAAFQIHQ